MTCCEVRRCCEPPLSGSLRRQAASAAGFRVRGHNKQLPWLQHRSSWATAWSACTRARCGNRIAPAALARLPRGPSAPEWLEPREINRIRLSQDRCTTVKATKRHPRLQQPPTRRPHESSLRSYWSRPVAAIITTPRPNYKSPRTPLRWSSFRSRCPVMLHQWRQAHSTPTTAAPPR